MDLRTNPLWLVPLGLLLGGLIGLGIGLALDNSPLWLILGAGGGMVIGLAASTAVANRRA